MDEACLEGQCKMVAQEKVRAGARLKVELEGGADIALADVGRGCPRAEVEEGNPAMAGGKVISQIRPASHEIGAFRVKLLAGKHLANHLPITSKPMVLGDHLCKDPSEVDATHSPIVAVSFQNPHAQTRTSEDIDFLGSGVET